MALLYVTSFSKKLYDISALKFINSYINQKIKEKILVCYEDFDYLSPNQNQIITYNLNNDNFLNSWLIRNKDIIPQELGGEATPSNNPKVYDPDGMNFRTSQFFRKIVSLKYALDIYGEQYDYIIWIDCDTVFRRYLPKEYVIQQFQDCGTFYHQGGIRESVDGGFETGFIGFQKNYGGYELLDRIIECFDQGTFRQYRGWFDGYVIKKVIQESNDIPSRDLTPDSIRCHVILWDSPFRQYIYHDKGRHRRNNAIL